MAKKAKKRVVLVGTYREGQLEVWTGLYNWPLGPNDEISETDAAQIGELWLFKGTKEQRSFKATFLGVKTREELVRDYAYPAKGKAHADKYLLFKTEELLASEPETAEKADRVILRIKDFATSRSVQRQLKAWLQSPDRKDPALAKYLPKIIVKLKPDQLRVCEAAMQLDFTFLYSNRAPQRSSSHAGDFPIISLFSGAGGLDIGFNQAGFRTAIMVEYDPACCRTLRKNLPDTPILEGDINQITTKQILSAAGLEPLDAALVIGGPPCQSFSLAGRRMGLNDPRGQLVLEFIRVVREALPKAFVMENVKGLANWERGKALDAIINEAQSPISYRGQTYHYKVCYKVLNAADFGAPQFRERIFIVGNRIDSDFIFPNKKYGEPGNKDGLTPYQTVRDAICHLPPAAPPSDVALRVSATIKARIKKHGY